MKNKSSVLTLMSLCATISDFTRAMSSTTYNSPPLIPLTYTGSGSKRSSGSGMLRRLGHPLFQRKHISYAQPFGYYAQTQDSRHTHPRSKRLVSSLPRPTFK